jgi:hypothetical protein
MITVTSKTDRTFLLKCGDLLATVRDMDICQNVKVTAKNGISSQDLPRETRLILISDTHY